jgi:hypothetical protein
VTGQIQTNNSILLANGSAGAPAMTFTSDPDTGFYRSDTNELSLTTGGTQRVIVNSSGNVGIGTAPGSFKLDIFGGAVRINNSVGIPIEIGSDFGGGSGGYANLELGKNRTSDGGAYIDLTAIGGGAGDYSTRILRETGSNGSFAITNTGTGEYSIGQSAAGPIVLRTTSLERMRIDSSGNIGIGAVAEDTYKLDVTGKSRAKTEFWVGPNTTNGFIRMTVDSGISYIQSSSNISGTHNKLYFTGFAGSSNTMVLDIPNRRVGIGGQTAPTVALDVTGDIKASGNITAYSDERFKTNRHPIVNALEKVGQMRGVSYETKEEGRRRIGVIAQEIEKIIPEVVLTDDTDEHYKSVDYGNIVAVLIEAVKELKAKVDELSSA